MIQWIGYCTTRYRDLNSAFLFFLFIPFLGAFSCSAYIPPGAFMYSCSVNHHHCFITWRQVETLSNKNVKMSSHVLLCHPCFHCINYFFFLCPAKLIRSTVVRESQMRKLNSSVGVQGCMYTYMYVAGEGRFWTGYRNTIRHKSWIIISYLPFHFSKILIFTWNLLLD